MKRYIWTIGAKLCLTRIRLFLEENGVPLDIAERIIQQIRLSPNKLLQFPRLGQLVNIVEGEEVRRILVKGYKIYYKVDGESILILSVIHDKEDERSL